MWWLRFLQLLGRATSIGAYVKRGEESGYIKITLRGDHKEEHITIMRKINTNNKSEWLFNGEIFITLDIEFYLKDIIILTAIVKSLDWF